MHPTTSPSSSVSSSFSSSYLPLFCPVPSSLLEPFRPSPFALLSTTPVESGGVSRSKPLLILFEGPGTDPSQSESRSNATTPKRLEEGILIHLTYTSLSVSSFRSRIYSLRDSLCIALSKKTRQSQSLFTSCHSRQSKTVQRNTTNILATNLKHNFNLILPPQTSSHQVALPSALQTTLLRTHPIYLSPLHSRTTKRAQPHTSSQTSCPSSAV